MTDPHSGSASPIPWQWLAPLLGAVTLWRLAAAHLIPVTRDEAYYFDWARSLAWGYFDHPPGVALLGMSAELVPTSSLAARLGTIAASTLTLLVLISFYRSCGLRERGILLLSLTIALTTLPGLAGGLLTTPDTVLALFWALALHEALAALRGSRYRWLSAGVATGLGLLGKYTMVLIGPVFLWAILWADPRALRTPWPYLGGLLALLAFSPNILWNADNDWLTMHYQTAHGFSTETGALISNPLPPASVEPPATVGKPEQAPSAVERVGGVLGYLGTQLGLWGLMALPLLSILLRREDRHGSRVELATSLDSKARVLLTAGLLFPLLFFGLVASFSEVEPNWPAMYLLSAAPLAGVALRRLWKWVVAAAAINVLLVSLYAVQATFGSLPLPSTQERILRETHGFDELAAKVAELDGLVFADRYQSAAMLRFHRPSLRVTQWPGITRPSEYLRGTISAPVGPEDVERAGGFWLITRKFSAPRVPGFREHSKTLLYACKGMELQEVTGDPPPCVRPLNWWLIFRYETKKREWTAD